jgi:hypothetical protein
VDEALGQPYQDSIIDVVNSFFKEPIVQPQSVQDESAMEMDADEEIVAEELKEVDAHSSS